jgi:hypothetical protein
MFGWTFDAFFWAVLPIALLEALRVARSQRKLQRYSVPASAAFGVLELLSLGICAATSSISLFVIVMMARLALVRLRERQWWVRGPLKAVMLAAAGVLLMIVGGVDRFYHVGSASIDETWRLVIIVLVCTSCAAATLPVRISDEPKETLAAPLAFIMFARVALPLGAHEPWFAEIVPIVAAAMSFLCALLLFSAGKRANHFEASTLVSELIVCERGVLLSFAWLGLASGEHLASVGGILQWWSGALALVALEASLRRQPVPKPKAFFALAMAVNLPGTIGFVAEDLLAHGLLVQRPELAAAYVAVVAINAAALYLALVNVMVDVQTRHPQWAYAEPEAPPSVMMLVAAVLSVVMGLVPQPFVTGATLAVDVVAPHAHRADH